MDATQTTIFRNTRIEEDDFKADIVCDFCNTQYNSQVLKIPFAEKWICKRCLEDAVRLLDENMQKNFQPDFEKARKSLIKYEGWEDEEP